MKYSTNYELNLPELADQFNLKHQNENTEKIDTQMKKEETDRTEADTALRNITDPVLKKALINLLYRKGSYYWTSDETFDPNVSWTGTWVRIKDKMLMAKGDAFTINGGNVDGTIILTEEQLPSHRHTYTPSGNIDAHSHPMPHTHNFSGSESGSGHRHQWPASYDGSWDGADYPSIRKRGLGEEYHSSPSIYTKYSKVTVSGTTEGTNTANTSSVTTKFHGTQGTTETTGSGSAINIMPPYEVAICWHRTE